jgi:hypothetical protein
MSKMSNLVLEIQEDLEAGILSFAEIAFKHECPISWVEDVHQEMVAYMVDQDYLDSDAHLNQLD